ncbi:MAG: helix-turn-helix transcriptional regulator [Isosphaeraceae bacterium]
MRTAVRFSLQRIAALDRAIRAGEYPNARTIARALEVGHRTVQRDIEFFRDRYGAPLAFDQRRNGYYYTEPDYSIPLLRLTEGELVALTVAERAFRFYQGTPYAQNLANAFDKITAGLTELVTVDLSQIVEGSSFRSSTATGIDPVLFREFESAIRVRSRLVLRYYSASSDEETNREVDPYHLASVDGQWYLVAYCHRRGEVRMFAPSRVRSFAPTGTTFEPPLDFRIDEYLAASLSVLRGTEGESHRVRLRFTGEAVKYVRERTWHVSQTLRETSDGAIVLGLTVGHLREVEKFALGWGASCEVLEPRELREKLARELAAAARLYLGPEE